MTEAHPTPTPIVKEAPATHIRTEGAEVKKFPELKETWTDIFTMLTASQDAGIFKKGPSEWRKDPLFSGKTPLALAIGKLSQNADKSVTALRKFDEAEKSGKIKFKPDGTIDLANSDKGAAELVKTTSACYPDAIRGIQLVIAATEGDPSLSQIALHAEAKRLLEEIKHNISLVSQKQGVGPNEVSYDIWHRQNIEGRAFALYKQANTLKYPNDPEREKKLIGDYQNSPEVIRLAYQAKAETEIIDQIGGVNYELVYAADQKAEIQHEELQKNAITAADTICQKVTGTAVSELDKDAEAKIDADPPLSWLMFVRLRLQTELDAKPDNRRPEVIQVLTAELSDAATNYLNANARLKGELAEIDKILLRNTAYYNTHEHPLRKQLVGRLFATGFDPKVAEYIDYGKMVWVTSLLTPAIEKDASAAIDPYHVGVSHTTSIISRLSEEGAINSYEESWLKHLQAHSRGEQNLLIIERNHGASAMGIGVGEIPTLFRMDKNGFGLNNFLREQRPAINRILFGETSLTANQEKARDALFNFLPGGIGLFSKDGFWSFNKTVLLIYLIQLSQSVLGYAGDEDGQQSPSSH